MRACREAAPEPQLMMQRQRLHARTQAPMAKPGDQHYFTSHKSVQKLSSTVRDTCTGTAVLNLQDRSALCLEISESFTSP
jgi:hypothetical protein